MTLSIRLHARRLAAAFALSIAALVGTAAQAEEGYLAVVGCRKPCDLATDHAQIELLRLTDFSPVAAIGIGPMQAPWLTYLPLKRRLYAWEHSRTDVKTVLDFGACSAGLLRPLDIPVPRFV